MAVDGLRAVGVEAAGCAGDDALLFAVDSLRSRAGSTRFWGVASPISELTATSGRTEKTESELDCGP